MNLRKLMYLRNLLQVTPQFNMPLFEHPYLIRINRIERTPNSIIFFEGNVILAVHSVNHPARNEDIA